MNLKTVFQNFAQIEQAMEELVEKEFNQADFFQSLLTGQYTFAQLRHFAIQYNYYSRHFPRVLGAALSAMPPMDAWWIPIADNLWDEAGRGEKGKSHEKLYQTFMFSVDPTIPVNSFGLPEEPISPAVEKAVGTFIDFFRHCTPLEAMAAVGLGSEMFAGNVMGLIAKGFRHPAYNKDKEINVTFWDVHANEHEPHHYQLCKDILIKYTKPEELETMYEVGSKIARSEALMYKELHEENRQIR